MEIIVTNILCKVEGDCPEEVLRELSYRLSFPVEGYAHTTSYKRGSWDGRRRLFNTRSKVFPTGLLRYVLEIFDKHKLSYVEQDKRVVPSATGSRRFRGFDLRDYQEEVVRAMASTDRGIIKACTGSGKTIMIGALVASHNVPTMIYVTTIDLLYQMKDALEKMLGGHVGQVGDGEVDLRKFTVSTVQSAVRYCGVKYQKMFGERSESIDRKQVEIVRQGIENASMIIFDESHHVRAMSIQTIAKHSLQAYYRWGASATPFRDIGDDLLIEAQLGGTVAEVTTSGMIEKGYLVPVTIYYLYCGGAKVKKTRYQKIYKEYIVLNDERNKKICDKVVELTSQGRPTLVLVHERDAHGQSIEDMLRKRNVPTMFVHGLLKSKLRRSLLARMRSGEVVCCILTSLGDEGLDIPPASGLILAGGGKSRTKILQRVGRILRPYEGKKDAVVYDFIDDYPYLLQHSLARIDVLKTEPLFSVKVENSKRVKQIVAGRRRKNDVK